MKNSAFKTLLFTAVVLVLATSVASAQPCPSEGGQFVVYFDAAGTQRYMDPGPPGTLVTLYVFGEGFDTTIPFVSGVQFCVDYGPNLNWLVDGPLFGAFIGGSSCDSFAGGLSLGFGFNPQFGNKFMVVKAVCAWTNDCTTDRNVDGPIVREHPFFPDPCPIVSRFPDQATFNAFGARSQTCQLVELDIKPGSCPNPFNINLFDWLEGDILKKGGVLPVAILGSETVDVNDIDPATVLLEGVAPLRYEYEDVATLDGHQNCECNDGDADGYMDMTLKFDKSAIAEAILGDGTQMVGQELPLVLTGAYMDGMPFDAADCITLVGNNKSKRIAGMEGASGLGFPTPNPFNPVTRISYGVATTQHVRIAIYDVAGRLVEELINETKNPGEYVVEWDAGNMPSGVYFYRMQTGDRTIVRRATLLK